jgi:hypothetical protein
MSGRTDTVRYDRIQTPSTPTVSRQSTLQVLQLEEDYSLRWMCNIPHEPVHDRINVSFERFVLNWVITSLSNLLKSAVVPKYGNQLFAGLHLYSLLLTYVLGFTHQTLYMCRQKNMDGFRNEGSILAFHWAVIVLKNQPCSFRIANTAHHFVVILKFCVWIVLKWIIRGSSPSRI